MKHKPITITFPGSKVWKTEPIAIPAAGYAHLAVHQAVEPFPGGKAKWTVSHIESGLPVISVGIKSKAAAHRLAVHLEGALAGGGWPVALHGIGDTQQKWGNLETLSRLVREWMQRNGHPNY